MSNRPRAEHRPLRIAQVVPVAQSVPPMKSGSIETITDLLVRGLTAHGHHVTLFATASSSTLASIHPTFDAGYNDDTSLWPWELCELFNIAAAVEQAASFDVIHCQAQYAPFSLAFQRICQTPIVHTVHHTPTPPEVELWKKYAEAPFIAISNNQAACLEGLRVVGTVRHAVDTNRFRFEPQPDDYLLFLGRFTPGKGVLDAIHVAQRTNMRLVLAAAENNYYHEHVEQHVDGRQVVFKGEVDLDTKIELLRRSRALLYPVQADEPFGLVLAEAMSCGTPVAALNRGAVAEIVTDGHSGGLFNSIDELVSQLPRVLDLDRTEVRTQAVEHFNPDRMVTEYINIYRSIFESSSPHVRDA